MKIINDQGRTCSKCKEFKTWEYYSKAGGKHAYGKQSSCKSCKNKWYLDNIDIYKKYHELNKEKISQGRKKYYLENKKHIRTQHALWLENNKDRVKIMGNEYKVKRRKTDELYKLECYLRAYAGRAFNYIKENKTEKTMDMLGCTLEKLKQHIEAQWEKGMSWDNHNLKGWHIDHIIPLSSANNKDEMIKLLHYTNLQPLWALDNFKKSNRI